MTTDPEANFNEAVIWCDERRAELVAQLLDAMGSKVSVIAVGGPREGAVDDLARDLGCERDDDLRKMLVNHPSRFVLISSTQGVGHDDLLTALGQSSVVLSTEPFTSEVTEQNELARKLKAAGSGGSPLSPHLVMLGEFVQSRGHLQAAEPTEALGERRLIVYHSVGRPGAASLFARLFDAWRTILRFADMPETIDASLAGAERPLPDDLRQLSGRFGAHGRTQDANTVVVSLADRGGRSDRHLQVAGEEGELRINDGGYSLWRSDGSLIDEADAGDAMPLVDVLAAQWMRLIDQPASVSYPPREHLDSQILACCQACLLSARTGEPENPATLLQMAG